MQQLNIEVKAIAPELFTDLSRVGQADAKLTKAGDALINFLVKHDYQPTFLLSPNDKQGKPDANTLSTAKPAQYTAMQYAIASGMGSLPKTVNGVKSFGELFLIDPDELAELIKDSKATLRKAKTGKVKLAAELEKLGELRKLRSELLRKVSSTLRDKSRVLITAYAKQAKQAAFKGGAEPEEAQKAYDATKAKLEKASGFAKKPKPLEDKKASSLKQQAGKLVDTIRDLEKSPLPVKEVNQLISLLNKLA